MTIFQNNKQSAPWGWYDPCGKEILQIQIEMNVPFCVTIGINTRNDH